MDLNFCVQREIIYLNIIASIRYDRLNKTKCYFVQLRSIATEVLDVGCSLRTNIPSLLLISEPKFHRKKISFKDHKIFLKRLLSHG